jgi:Chalcone isomerase-like
MIRGVLALLLACFVSIVPAGAATYEGVTFPDQFPVDGKPLVLNGMGLRTVTVLGIRAYVAGLYLEQQSHDAAAILKSSGPKVVLMQFLRGATRDQIQHQYREGEQNNCGTGACPQTDQQDFERLVDTAPAVQFGDTFTYVISSHGLQMLHNNKLLVSFTNPDLGYRILDGFIGAHPPSEAVKSGLLGLGAN